MKLTCRQHAEPQPAEPTVELYMEQIGDTVRVFASAFYGAVCHVAHDGERFVVTPLNDTRLAGAPVDQPPSRAYQIRMVDKPPDRPGAWLRKTASDLRYMSTQVSMNHDGRSLQAFIDGAGWMPLSQVSGPWSDKPLEIEE